MNRRDFLKKIRDVAAASAVVAFVPEIEAEGLVVSQYNPYKYQALDSLNRPAYFFDLGQVDSLKFEINPDYEPPEYQNVLQPQQFEYTVKLDPAMMSDEFKEYVFNRARNNIA